MQTTVQFQKLPILALACLLTACSGGDANGPGDPPPPGSERRFNFSATLRYVAVTSAEACDGREIFTGDPRDGEFQYRVEIRLGGSTRGSLESSGYGTFLGTTYSGLPGSVINFTNRTVVLDSLKPGDRVSINFYGTEWDVGKDSDMDDLHSSTDFLITDNFSVGTVRDAALRLPKGGSNDCELTLIYDLSVTMFMVPAP